MRVIVTRPEREAEHWVRLLGQRGFDALALPLIAIGPAADPEPLRDAWRRLPGFAAVMFVSGNAVDYFFREKAAADGVDWLHPALQTRAWATGPGTAGTLAAAGVDPRLIDAPVLDAMQFDSEALWQRVAGQAGPGRPVLIVRGDNSVGHGAGHAGQGTGRGAGRDWLTLQLEAAGAPVDTIVAYARDAPRWSAGQLTVAKQAAGPESVWLFSSSEGIGNLVRLLPAQNWTQARAVATHRRIALAARRAGFGVVCESLPTLDAIGAALESIR